MLVKVSAAPVEDVKDDGIVVAPQSINPNYFKGEVVRIGGTVERSNSTGKAAFSIGDKVAFLKYGYEDMGDGLYIVEEPAILYTYED